MTHIKASIHLKCVNLQFTCAQSNTGSTEVRVDLLKSRRL